MKTRSKQEKITSVMGVCHGPRREVKDTPLFKGMPRDHAWYDDVAREMAGSGILRDVPAIINGQKVAVLVEHPSFPATLRMAFSEASLPAYHDALCVMQAVQRMVEAGSKIKHYRVVRVKNTPVGPGDLIEPGLYAFDDVQMKTWNHAAGYIDHAVRVTPVFGTERHLHCVIVELHVGLKDPIAAWIGEFREDSLGHGGIQFRKMGEHNAFDDMQTWAFARARREDPMQTQVLEQRPSETMKGT